MLELIDRQAALKKMCETCGYCEKLEKAVRTAHPDFVSDKCNAYKFLAEQPTVEPEERHGRWIIKRDEFYTAYKMYYAECSECKHTESTGMVERLKYCPNCGAKMDGGSENV